MYWDLDLLWLPEGDSIWGIDKVEEAVKAVAQYPCLKYRPGEKWTIGLSKPMLITFASM